MSVCIRFFLYFQYVALRCLHCFTLRQMEDFPRDFHHRILPAQKSQQSSASLGAIGDLGSAISGGLACSAHFAHGSEGGIDDRPSTTRSTTLLGVLGWIIRKWVKF